MRRCAMEGRVVLTLLLLFLEVSSGGLPISSNVKVKGLNDANRCSKNGICGSTLLMSGDKIRHQTTMESQHSREIQATLEIRKCVNSQDLVPGIKPNHSELLDFCAKHCDGLYSFGCMEDYLVCSNQLPYIMSCSLTLILDTTKSRCVERSELQICNNSPPQNDSNRLVSKINGNVDLQNFSCVGQDRKFLAVGCSAMGIACLFSEAVIYSICPEPMMFDTKSQACLPADQVEECNFKEKTMISELEKGRIPHLPISKPKTEKTSSKPPSSFSESLNIANKTFNSKSYAQSSQPLLFEQTPKNIITYSCKNHVDGLFGENCAEDVAVCFGERTVMLRCPKGFLFDALAKVCLQESTIAKCNKTFTQQKVLLENAEEQNFVPSETENEGMTSVQDKFSCENLQDGIHGGRCSNHLFVCLHGIKFSFLTCGEEKFHLRTRACMPKAEMLECSQEHTVHHNIPLLVQSAKTFMKTKQAEEASAILIVDNTLDHWLGQPKSLIISCLGIPNGIYGDTCATEFYACIDNNAALLRCPYDFVFDAEAKCCKSQDVVPLKLEETLLEFDSDEQEHSLTIELPISTKQPLKSLSDFSCEFLPDGIYGQGCSQQFIACVGGSVIPMICPKNLKDVDACRYEKAISVVLNETELEFDNLPPIIHPPSIMEFPSCENKVDGLYDKGCSGEFYACVNGSIIPMRCPGLQKFDKHEKRCMEGVSVAACGKISALKQTSEVKSNIGLHLTDSQALSNMTKLGEMANAVDTTSSHKEDSSETEITRSKFSCVNAPDEVYVEGCSEKVTLCLSEKPVHFKCPDALKYDVRSKTCLPKVLVSTCQDHSIQRTKMAPVPSQMFESTCEDKPDGTYAQGCTPEFTVCTSGAAAQYRCNPPLMYDEELEICRDEKFIKACNEQNTTEAKKIDCTKEKDGLVSSGCSSNFQYCINGKLEKYTCPLHLKFDNITEQCLEESLVPACAFSIGQEMKMDMNGTGPSLAGNEDSTFKTNQSEIKKVDNLKMPIVYLIVSTPSNENGDVATNDDTDNINGVEENRDMNVSRVSCKGKSNGMNSIGCTSQSYACINETTFILYCIDPLKFDHISKKCVEARHVASCAGHEDQKESVTMLGLTDSAREKDWLKTIPLDFPCADKTNGVFEAGPCSSSFLVCIQNQDFTLHCPPEYAYQESLQRCVKKEQLPQCKKQPVIPKLSATIDDIKSSSSTNETSCNQIDDGLYVVGCNSTFFACIGGQKLMMRCPGLQKFDAGLLKCLPQQYVQECIQTHKELGIQELKFATFEIKDIQEGLLHLHPIDAPFNASLSADFGEVFPFAPFVSSCIGIPDGKYARGCSEKFISCMNGRMKLHKCPSSLLKFDSTTQRCLPVPVVKACGGNYIASKLKPQKQLKKAISLQYPRLTCEKQADGKYATGCSPQFIECNRNEGSVFRCPGSLIFDAQTERCLPASYVNACNEGGEVEILTSQWRQNQTSYIHRSLQEVFNCENLPDGIYGQKCSPGFIMCLFGISLPYSCPGELIFDSESEKCLAPDSVNSCVEVTYRTTTEEVKRWVRVKDVNATNDDNKRSMNFRTLTNLNTPLPVAYLITDLISLDTKLYFCVGKPDGIYADDCPTDFMLCVAETGLALHCTNSLRYDKVSRMCKDETEIAECRNKTGPVHAAYPPNTLYAKRQNLPLDWNDWNLNLTGYCANRLNGFYAEGCSAKFVACFDGKGFSYDCPRNMKFNEVLGICTSQEDACKEKIKTIEEPDKMSKLFQIIARTLSSYI